MALNAEDFTITKHGSKKYHFFCDNCSKDRGYLFKNQRGGKITGPLCVRCKNSGSKVEKSNGYCDFCDISHNLPLKGTSNEFWLWDKNVKALDDGYWRCKEQLKDKNNNWKMNNPEKFKLKEQRSAQKYRSTPQGKIRSSISARMSNVLAKNSTYAKTNKTKFSNLDWTIKDLMKHLESKFELGMTWTNYGEWHIDHVTPDSWFKYSSTQDEDFKRSWSLSNLQPMWAPLNLRKSNKFAGGW